MKVKKLTTENIQDLISLSDKLYSPLFKQDFKDLEYNFKEMEDKNCNFSLGLYDKDKLVGYIISWLDESLIIDNDEDIIFIDDLAIIPEYRNYLFFLFSSYVNLLKNKGVYGLAIEAVARENLYNLLNDHLQVLNRLGFELVNDYSYYSEDFLEDMIWIRLEVVNE